MIGVRARKQMSLLESAWRATFANFFFQPVSAIILLLSAANHPACVQVINTFFPFSEEEPPPWRVETRRSRPDGVT